jgi:ELWxxDGT repeat protein
VKDLGPDTFGNIELTVVGTTLFFVADDGSHGSELWTSDGSPDGTAGTHLVDDIST